MDRVAVGRWIDAYERAWRTAGTECLASLFTDDATYSMDPYGDTAQGLVAIGGLWERERVGPDERFTMSYELVAVDGGTGVARVEVQYLDKPQAYRDLWIMQFAADGRCRAFEEWPYWPGKFHEGGEQ